MQVIEMNRTRLLVIVRCLSFCVTGGVIGILVAFSEAPVISSVLNTILALVVALVSIAAGIKQVNKKDLETKIESPIQYKEG